MKTQKEIENTFKYYTQNTKEFEKVYEKVSEKIAKLEEEYNKSIEASGVKKKPNAVKRIEKNNEE